MNKIVRSSICMLALSVLGTGVTPLLAAPAPKQEKHDRDDQARHDRDHDNNAGMADESAYYNNKYYKSGWNDGVNHKRKNHKWKNDDDRRAYEAGLAHGERGEKWESHKRMDHDHDHDQH